MKKIDKKIVLITITIVYFIISLSTYINFGYKDIIIKNIGKNSSYSLGNDVYINYIAFDDIKIKNGHFDIELKSGIIIPEWFEKLYLDDREQFYDEYYSYLENYTDSFLKTISEKRAELKELIG